MTPLTIKKDQLADRPRQCWGNSKRGGGGEALKLTCSKVLNEGGKIIWNMKLKGAGPSGRNLRFRQGGWRCILSKTFLRVGKNLVWDRGTQTSGMALVYDQDGGPSRSVGRPKKKGLVSTTTFKPKRMSSYVMTKKNEGWGDHTLAASTPVEEQRTLKKKPRD